MLSINYRVIIFWCSLLVASITDADRYNATLMKEVFAKIRMLLWDQQQKNMIKHVIIDEDLQSSAINQHISLEISKWGYEFVIDIKTPFGTFCYAEATACQPIPWVKQLEDAGLPLGKVSTIGLDFWKEVLICPLTYQLKKDKEKFFDLSLYKPEQAAKWEQLRPQTQLMD